MAAPFWHPTNNLSAVRTHFRSMYCEGAVCLHHSQCQLRIGFALQLLGGYWLHRASSRAALRLEHAAAQAAGQLQEQARELVLADKVRDVGHLQRRHVCVRRTHPGKGPARKSNAARWCTAEGPGRVEGSKDRRLALALNPGKELFCKAKLPTTAAHQQ